ncbi:hypothetical protein I6A60_20245 [Frankia sp. AgB1.9]|nr:hypothetical protein [Frankia sp. AgW1.1]MBL7550194.1 hypothetical protein [Frankia sp. AgB1.9]
MSQCEFRLPTDDALTRCIAALRASDEMLAARPDSSYDWQATWVERSSAGGGTVSFGVAWYDEAFFNDKRDAFLGPEHGELFARIGIPQGASTVSHWLAA